MARGVILLLQIRILGAASYLFTGVSRLPMAAGWDHLIPEWFSRLHPRYRTPTNSILVAAVLIGALIVMGSSGVQAEAAFNVLNNASSEFYVVAYLTMFAIPVIGFRLLRKWIPTWAMVIYGVGFVTTIVIFGLNAYPFDGSSKILPFATEIVGTTVVVNVIGYAFYRTRSLRTRASVS
jgi:amino acid transporter